MRNELKISIGVISSDASTIKDFIYKSACHFGQSTLMFCSGRDIDFIYFCWEVLRISSLEKKSCYS